MRFRVSTHCGVGYTVYCTGAVRSDRKICKFASDVFLKIRFESSCDNSAVAQTFVTNILLSIFVACYLYVEWKLIGIGSFINHKSLSKFNGTLVNDDSVCVCVCDS